MSYRNEEKDRDKSEEATEFVRPQDGTESAQLTTHSAGWRHIVTLVAFIGFLCMYSLRINMSVALVAMVNHKAVAKLSNSTSGTQIKSTSICIRKDDSFDVHSFNTSKSKDDGPFVWDAQQQGIILSSFFYGYIVTQFAGGVLASKYGAKWVFGIGNVMTGVLALLSPAAAEIGFGAFIAVRVLQGVSSGVTWPSMQAFFARWAPPSERSTLPALAYAGSFVGTPLTFLLSGLLIDSGFLGGWPSVFYFFGVLCCIWFIFWAVLSSSGPENHRFISRSEQTYIVKSLQVANAGAAKPGISQVPWKDVVKTPAIWAAVASHFTYNWGLYVIMTILPTYFRKVQGFDIKKNGFLSALPYMTQFVVHICSGKGADYLRVKFKLRTVVVRKIFDVLGHLLPAIFIALVGFVGCDDTAAVTMLTLAVASTGLCGGGWFVNFLDLAPQFAGILFGISNTFSTIPGIVGPYLAGYLTIDNTIAGWRTVFFIISGLYAFAAVVFLLFGQGNVQPWASSTPNHDERDRTALTGDSNIVDKRTTKI